MRMFYRVINGSIDEPTSSTRRNQCFLFGWRQVGKVVNVSWNWEGDMANGGVERSGTCGKPGNLTVG